MSERDRVKGFFIGTGSDPLGAAVDIQVDREAVEVRIDPMAGKSRKKPLRTNGREAAWLMKAMLERLRAESYRRRAITPNLKPKRKPGIRGEWIECPVCHAKHSDDCETCWGRGAIWQSY